jgi:threonine dehydrogenase-like Zn-dependent dehydrogenase
MSRSRLFLIGRSGSRLAAFNDICTTVNIVKDRQSLKEMEGSFSMVVEAVGGYGMAHSLRQAVALVQPRGRIHVFGLADEVQDINFTQIVNKGLIIQGFSRARFSDYKTMMDIMCGNSRLLELLERVIDPEGFIIRNEEDLMDAFHYVMSGNNNGRVIVAFEEDVV